MTEPTDYIVYSRELREMLQISSETVKNWMKSGKLPGFDINLSTKTRGWRLSTLKRNGVNVPEFGASPSMKPPEKTKSPSPAVLQTKSPSDIDAEKLLTQLAAKDMELAFLRQRVEDLTADKAALERLFLAHIIAACPSTPSTKPPNLSDVTARPCTVPSRKGD